MRVILSFRATQAEHDFLKEKGISEYIRERLNAWADAPEFVTPELKPSKGELVAKVSCKVSHTEYEYYRNAAKTLDMTLSDLIKAIML